MIESTVCAKFAGTVFGIVFSFFRVLVSTFTWVTVSDYANFFSMIFMAFIPKLAVSHLIELTDSVLHFHFSNNFVCPGLQFILLGQGYLTWVLIWPSLSISSLRFLNLSELKNSLLAQILFFSAETLTLLSYPILGPCLGHSHGSSLGSSLGPSLGHSLGYSHGPSTIKTLDLSLLLVLVLV